MSTDRTHPRDAISPAVQAMFKDLAEVASGTKLADIDPPFGGEVNPRTFPIPTGLVPGVDHHLPTSGLLLLYIDQRADQYRIERHCKKLLQAISGYLHSYDNRYLLTPGVAQYMGERDRLCKLRSDAVTARQLAVVTRPLLSTRDTDRMEDVADLALYFYEGIGGNHTILERGKLRRAEHVMDKNMALSIHG